MNENETERTYGFYSKILNKPFDTLDELVEAEEEYEAEEKKKSAAKEEKKADAKRVENAYKNYVDVCKTANDEIETAHTEYIEARNSFINKYGSYHQSYFNDGTSEHFSFSDFFEGLGDFSKFFLN